MSTFCTFVSNLSVSLRANAPLCTAYMNSDRLKLAEKLHLVLIAGIGSDHIDLEAAANTRSLTVAECTGAVPCGSDCGSGMVLSACQLLQAIHAF